MIGDVAWQSLSDSIVLRFRKDLFNLLEVVPGSVSFSGQVLWITSRSPNGDQGVFQFNGTVIYSVIPIFFLLLEGHAVDAPDRHAACVEMKNRSF
jgi:hypothetical protein